MTERADPGLQPERTALAWRRLSLALVVAAAAVARVAPIVLGPWALAPAIPALALAVVVLVISQRRYLSARRALSDPAARPRLAAGGLLATTGFTAVLLGALAVALVLRIGA
jgi:uncharacterized membrane protein YidH (DUF202 family)